jgi:hypothetical protein
VFCVNYFVRSATIILAGSLSLRDGWVNPTHHFLEDAIHLRNLLRLKKNGGQFSDFISRLMKEYFEALKQDQGTVVFSFDNPHQKVFDTFLEKYPSGDDWTIVN